LALPVTLRNSSLFKLGILKFTWSSEHYGLDYVRELVKSSGFKITDEQLIGDKVYAPLAKYYIENSKEFKKSIL
jgi:hypothetical protein